MLSACIRQAEVIGPYELWDLMPKLSKDYQAVKKGLGDGRRKELMPCLKEIGAKSALLATLDVMVWGENTTTPFGPVVNLT